MIVRALARGWVAGPIAALSLVSAAAAQEPVAPQPAAPLSPPLAGSVQAPTEAPPAPPPLPFAAEIARFAELDAASPPPTCGYLFVGSSTIRFWNTLGQDMAPYPVINRGFGGSKIEDVDFYFDRVVAPYHPRAIVFYAGENDLSAGQTVDQVVANFQRFLDLKTAQLGDAPVYFISLKPSKLRLAQMPLQSEVNARIRALAEARPDLDYIDVTPAMLDQGVPKDLYVEDGLHMNPQGYALWTQIVRPALDRDAQSGRMCTTQTVATAP